MYNHVINIYDYFYKNSDIEGVFMKKAFTLAEILIVLVLIGVLTMILLPMAFQSSPDEKVMKFKKGYNTLNTVIKELVSSDKYYQDGDLGVMAGGKTVNSATYFCETFADCISTKSVKCSENKLSNPYAFSTRLDVGYKMVEGDPADPDGNYTGQTLTLELNQKQADIACSENTDSGEEIVTTDGIIYYQTSPGHHFGWEFDYGSMGGNLIGKRYYGGKENGVYLHRDANGFDRIYKVFCMDIDGINKGEAPFGFGIRADGKILTGMRATEWLNKEI